MTEFKYVAFTPSGKRKKGKLQAESLEEARLFLKADSFTPIKIEEMSTFTKEIYLPGTKRVSNKEIVVFLRQFSAIYQTGLPMVSTLNLVRKQTENLELESAIYRVVASIEKGVSLSRSFKNEHLIFPSLFCELVAVGEHSGTLNQVLDKLTDHYEKLEEVKNTTVKALIYPAVVVSVVLAVLAVMMTQVIPRFESIFASSDTPLPLITKIVMNSCNFIANNVIFMIILIGILAFLIRMFAKSEKGKYFFGFIELKTPFVKSFIINRETAMFSNVLSILLNAGIPILEALDITKTSLKNIYFKDATSQTLEQVTKGNSLGISMSGTLIFPSVLCQMSTVGEESGKLSNMLEKSSEYYEKQRTIATERMLAGLEPTIMLFLSVFVAIIVFAIVIPMFSMYGTIL